MPGTSASQLTLSLFDTTALSGGFTLDAPQGGLRYREPAAEEADEAPGAVSIASVPSAPEPARVPARTWRLVGERALARGWKARAADNLAAIRLADAITREGRNATAEEQEVLSRFVGFGASELANTLFRRPGEAFRPGWEDLGTALEQLVTPEQLAELARATQYAHYTPEFIVRAIWRAVTRMGFAGGTVLEPGCGTGLFLAGMPEVLAGKTSWTAVEQDPCTARIASLLHPDAWVRCEDFTKARIAEGYELAIGNPPFSDRTVRADDPAGKLGLSLHDYFIARGIERLKPGGMAAFVTSRFTMDKADPTARGHIAGMADLVGAVRLPQGAMQAAAGTDVVVDVLVFQRRAPGAEPGGAAWDGLAEVLPEEDGEPAIHVTLARAFALVSIVLIAAITATALHRAPRSRTVPIAAAPTLAGTCAVSPPSFEAFGGSRTLGAPAGPIPLAPALLRPPARLGAWPAATPRHVTPRRPRPCTPKPPKPEWEKTRRAAGETATRARGRCAGRGSCAGCTTTPTTRSCRTSGRGTCRSRGGGATSASCPTRRTPGTSSGITVARSWFTGATAPV